MHNLRLLSVYIVYHSSSLSTPSNFSHSLLQIQPLIFEFYCCVYPNTKNIHTFMNMTYLVNLVLLINACVQD